MGKITPPEPFTEQHNTICFTCGVPSLDDWLRKQALKNEVSGASRTYVVCDGVKVVAYYSFTTGSVTCVHSPNKIPPEPVPVIVLGRLAVDTARQGRGIGFGLLKDAVSRSLYVAEKIDVRALLAHALNEQTKNFYARYGFTELTIEPMILTLPTSTFQKKKSSPQAPATTLTTASCR